MNEKTTTPKPTTKRPITNVRRWKIVKEAVANSGLMPQDSISDLIGGLEAAALEEVARG